MVLISDHHRGSYSTFIISRACSGKGLESLILSSPILTTTSFQPSYIDSMDPKSEFRHLTPNFNPMSWTSSSPQHSKPRKSSQPVYLSYPLPPINPARFETHLPLKWNFHMINLQLLRYLAYLEVQTWGAARDVLTSPAISTPMTPVTTPKQHLTQCHGTKYISDILHWHFY